MYDYLLELCQTERQQHPVPDRPEVNWPSDKGELKEAFLSKLFGTIRTMQRSPVYNVFARAFPEIARYLIASKTNNYRQTSWDCQKLESRLMIDGACTSVLTNYPEVVLLTVHDAVLVQQKLVGAVESAIQDQFRSVGVTPTLKIDGVPSRLLAGRRRKEQTITHTPSIPMSCTSNV